MGFLICTSYPHPFIFSMLFGKILPILKPRFYEYFSNQLRSQWFPSSHFLLHVFAAPVLQHSPCFNSLTISLCLSSYLGKGPCPPSESMHWLIYCWLNLIPHFFFSFFHSFNKYLVSTNILPGTEEVSLLTFRSPRVKYQFHSFLKVRVWRVC